MIGIVLKNIFRHRLKSFLTAIGIILGTVAVTTVFSVGYGGADEIDGLFSKLGFDGVIITAPVNGKSVFEGKLSKSDIEYMSSQFPEIKSTMPLIYTSAKYGIDAKEIKGFAVGFTDNTDAIADSTLKFGRTFTKAEIYSSSSVCLIDNETAVKIYGRENIVGKRINVSLDGTSERVEVVGVISNESPIGSIVKTYASGNIYLPYTLIDKIQGSSSYSGVVLSLDSSADENIKDVLMKSISEYKDISGYEIRDISAQESQIKDITEKLTLIISAVAAVSLIVAGAGIMSVMLSNVQERKKEIGIKLSIGASPGRIKNEFIAEASLISLISGLIGLGISSIAVNIIGKILKINIKVDAITAIFALLFCGIIGIIFSVYPAKKAAALNPVDCLRSD